MAYYVIRDSSAVPTAVVDVERRSAKAFTHDLEWMPFDQPHEHLEECDYEESRQQLYAIVRHVRAERQRTQWQGEYEYFVHLQYPGLADTLKAPQALVRCRAGVRELLGPDGAWQPTGEDPEGTISVPISEAEHDRLRWLVAEPRWFVARDELPYPVAVVRRIPAVAEAYTRNLRWEPVPAGLELEAVDHEYQADDLQYALETGVRLARRTGGPEYVGVLAEPHGELHIDRVFCLLRRDNGVDEIYIREGLWVPSEQLRDLEENGLQLHRPLPLSAEEVEQVTARLSGSRCLVVDDGRTVPRAVVHLDGDTERVFGHDLEWRTAGLLEEVADHPHWTVKEMSPGDELLQAYYLARSVRQFKQRHEWDGPVWYFGIYDSVRDAFDIGATRILVATRAGDKWFGERYAGQGRWEPTRKLDDIWRGKSYDDELPLSPAEAEAIMKRIG